MYMMRKTCLPPFFSFVIILCCYHRLFISASTSTRRQKGVGVIIRDGETLVSKNGIFTLGFFDPNKDRSSTKNRYLGLWTIFSSDRVVWVANREKPVTHSFGVFKLTAGGDLIISQNESSIDHVDTIWSSKSSDSMGSMINPIAKLLDSGNLVVTNGKFGEITWQSFDYPSDTLLPGMKLGYNKKTGHQWSLTAWKETNDPSPGEFVMKMDTSSELHEGFTYINNKKVKRYGIWNGKWLVGFPEMKEANTYLPNGKMNKNIHYTYIPTFVNNQTQVFYRFRMYEKNTYALMWLSSKHIIYTVFQTNESSGWLYIARTIGKCDQYSLCGPNSLCNNLNPKNCECFQGFHPKSSIHWNVYGDYSMGCQRNHILNCTNDEGFLHLQDVKTPETTDTMFHKNSTIEECHDRCINNCSCTAFAPLYLEGIIPRGCIMWYGDIIDTVLYSKGDGEELFLRLPKSDLDQSTKQSSKDRKKTPIIVLMVAVGMLVIIFFGIFIFIRMKKAKRRQKETSMEVPMLSSYDVPLYDFCTIAKATGNFSSDNKIGKGGFGDVYKGKMDDGQEIAVKRLCKPSRTGLDDFMNEATLIAKLQHRNLLRLLGCCMEGDEMILVYEFMKNSSLDTFIFGENQYLLDWPKRVEIIKGIAKGLLYLHQDSRLRIIHRDLKPGNVLLDEVMNPKISDFGTAKLFESELQEDNTRRVIGTYGYMSPEYASNGIFSIKSDVFSFGVLMLEIISGKKNRVYYQVNPNVNLLEQAWILGKKGKSIELLDERLNGSCSISQVAHFIQIGSLCVQSNAVDRPTMSDVFLMLNNEISSLKEAKKPAFCMNDSSDLSDGKENSNNIASLTMLKGR